MRWTFTVLTLMVVCLSGCANGLAFRPAELGPGEAAIYVYRPSTSLAIEVIPGIMVDGENLGDLQAGEYVFKIVQPGNHVVTGKTLIGHNVPIVAHAGETHYVKVDMTPGGVVIGPIIRKVDDYTGRTEIRKTELVYE
jgi:hypothetical protein